MGFDWQESRRAFADATDWFVSTVDLAEGRWAEPGLGEWDVRALVGHTSRALLTVEAYLAQPADAVDIGSAADYFQAALSIAAGPEVAERGRAAGIALGDDPVQAVAEIARRVVPLIDAQGGDELVTTIVGGMRLADYLPTRTFELAAHTADLAAALGAPRAVPVAAARQALSILAELGAADGRAGDLILAQIGRRGLPEGFTLL